ncbi:MAG: glycosyltransferase family 39 protein [Chloroflexi bacterium]|nr:glycosyltransferase family 39 protein [Chloroflexota bacterium]
MAKQDDLQRSGRPSVLVLALLTAIVLLAFALRAYRIDGQSFWYDEGISATLAPRSLATITLSAAADIHPPLYYYLLHFWSSLVGTGELALRWLSLIFGVLLVVLVFKIGTVACRDVACNVPTHNRPASAPALIACFFAATSPLLIYYSQEARMYIQTAFLGALSTYLFLRILRPLRVPSVATSQPRVVGHWIAYAVVTIAFLYSHYFAFSLLLAQNLYFLALWGPLAFARARRSTPGPLSLAPCPWLPIQALILLSFLPWLLMTYAGASGWPSISEPFDLPTLLRRVFLVFSFGLSWDASATPNRELVFLLSLGGLVLYALVVGRASLGRILWPVLYLLVPVLVMYALSLRRPMYNPKFLLLAAPGYYLLLGIGLIGFAEAASRVVRRPAFARGILPATIIAAFLFGATYGTWSSTYAYYHDAKYARDDYRGLAAYVESLAEPGDAIVLNAPGQVEVFEYYYKGDLPRFPLPQERPIDEGNAERQLRTLAESYSRLWLVLWAVPESDPRGFIEGWLVENAFKADSRWFGNIRLVLFSLPTSTDADYRQTNVNFGNKARLTGYRIGKESLRPGDVVDLVLYWQAIGPISERYTVFVHVIDQHEYLWGQRDGEPGGGAKITSIWKPGETVEDRHGVPVLLGTPPGDYKLELGLYDAGDGRRLPILDEGGTVVGDRFLFGTLRVSKPGAPPGLRSLMMQHQVSSGFGKDVLLLGYDFHKLGFGRDNVEIRPGDIALLTLYWQAAAGKPADYDISLAVLDKAGRTVLGRDIGPAEGAYRTDKWESDEIVRDQHKLLLRDLSPGEYVLTLGLTDAATGQPVPAAERIGNIPGRIELTKFAVR